MALKVGTKAPDITLPSTSGKNFILSKDAAGKACVIYFYPKDFTPGCTKEACDFRDQFAGFRDLDIPVLGISRDTMASHIKFKNEHKLPFDLLSDTSGKVCKAYDAMIPILKMPKRVTYFLDKDHIIRGVFSDMFESKKHVEEMIKMSKP